MMNKIWYSRRSPLCWLLLPFSAFFWIASGLRRLYLRRWKQIQFDVPVIVVGNLTVGGVGKTPLVIAIANELRMKGLRVGIVSRGYGARVHFPRVVGLDDNATDVGDEPLLIAKKTNCPVIIATNRVKAVQYLMENFQSQVILSDDGLQHYAMGRSIEIVVIDGVRGLGNGLLLPAGPLRERAHRLNTVDFVVVNSGKWVNAYCMKMVVSDVTQLISGNQVNLNTLHQPVAAIAGIGNPQRFYNTLNDLGVRFKPYDFPDHYLFTINDLILEEKIMIMTEKDAVKCLPFATENMYVLSVKADLENKFWDALWTHEKLKGVL